MDYIKIKADDFFKKMKNSRLLKFVLYVVFYVWSMRVFLFIGNEYGSNSTLESLNDVELSNVFGEIVHIDTNEIYIIISGEEDEKIYSLNNGVNWYDFKNGDYVKIILDNKSVGKIEKKEVFNFLIGDVDGK